MSTTKETKDAKRLRAGTPVSGSGSDDEGSEVSELARELAPILSLHSLFDRLGSVGTNNRKGVIFIGKQGINTQVREELKGRTYVRKAVRGLLVDQLNEVLRTAVNVKPSFIILEGIEDASAEIIARLREFLGEMSANGHFVILLGTATEYGRVPLALEELMTVKVLKESVEDATG